jgi:hypothetical protein
MFSLYVVYHMGQYPSVLNRHERGTRYRGLLQDPWNLTGRTEENHIYEISVWVASKLYHFCIPVKYRFRTLELHQAAQSWRIVLDLYTHAQQILTIRKNVVIA